MLNFDMLIPDLSLDSASYFAMREEEMDRMKSQLNDLLDDADYLDEDEDDLNELLDYLYEDWNY